MTIFTRHKKFVFQEGELKLPHSPMTGSAGLVLVCSHCPFSTSWPCSAPTGSVSAPAGPVLAGAGLILATVELISAFSTSV